MPRELTEVECRERFQAAVQGIADHWCRTPLDAEDQVKRRVWGAAYNILALLRGCHPDLPAWIVAPRPHPNDKSYCIGMDEDWWPENGDAVVQCDISGKLCDRFYPEGWNSYREAPPP